MADKPKPEKPKNATAQALPIDEIRQAVEKVQHGSVNLIIQDGRVIQIDIIEKMRLV